MALMLANWGIEAQKWHLSIKHLQKITYWRSFRAILSGISFAVNTPNRTGEYLGRILYVDEGNRLKAVSITILNSWSQLLITLLTGCSGLFIFQLYLGKATIEEHGLSIFWMRSLQWVLIVITVLFMLLYFRLGLLVSLLERIPLINKYSRYFNVLQGFRRKELWNMLALSFLRYTVFLAQYLLIFSVFKVDMSWWEGCLATSVMFLLLAIVPTIALAELGLRGEISLQVFGLLTTNKLGIIAATGAIWFINLLIPAIAGSVLLIGLRIFRKNNIK